MPLILYLVVALLTIAAWNRWVTPISQVAALILILVPMPFAGFALVTNRIYGGHDMIFLCQPWLDSTLDYGLKIPHNWYLLDQALQLAPWQHQVRQSLARHEWPLWNPAMNSGDILAASMQAAPYNPINLIALLLPLDLTPTFTAATMFFFAALFTFAFVRELRCSEEAALIAATGFAFSSAVVFWIGWTHLESWTLLPWVMLAVRRVVRTPGVASFSLLTSALVLLVLFGHPETMLHVAMIGVIYGAFELVPLWRDALRPIVVAVVSGATALLITAIFLLPFLAIMRSSWEYDLYRQGARGPSNVTAHAIGRAAGATFIPYYGGASWYNLTDEWDIGMMRVGSIILALAFVAVLRLWRNRDVRFLAGLWIVALIAGLNAPPVATLLRKLPLFDVSKNERLGFAAAFALCVLAAMAFDARTAISRSRWIVAITGTLLALATVLLWSKRAAFGVQPMVMSVGIAAEVLGIAVLLIALGSSRPRLAVSLILAAIAVQRLAEDGGIYPASKRRLFYPEVPLIRAIPRDPLYRVVGTTNFLIPNAATMYGLQDVRGYASLTYARYKKTVSLWSPDQRSYHDVTDLSRPFLSFLGVRHAITPSDMPPPPGWRVVMDDRSTRLMESDHAVPRVFVPRRIRFINSDDTSLEEMRQTTDFAEKAWIYTRDVLPQDADNGDADVRVRRVAPAYEIDVDARSGARIVISDAGWPGWRAYVDGRRVKLERANVAFLSVYVPEGRHRLRVVYLPDAFVQGRAISGGTLVLLGIAIVVRVRRRRARISPATRRNHESFPVPR